MLNVSSSHFGPICDIDRVEIPQRSSALCAIPFVRKHGRYWAVKRREFISLRDVRSILDANYLHRDPALGESAIAKLERGTKTPN